MLYRAYPEGQTQSTASVSIPSGAADSDIQQIAFDYGLFPSANSADVITVARSGSEIVLLSPGATTVHLVPTVTESALGSYFTGPMSWLRYASSGLSAYHGYMRNKSIAWAFVWGIAGFWIPVIVPAIAYAQGFSKPAVRGNPSRTRRSRGYRRGQRRTFR